MKNVKQNKLARLKSYRNWFAEQEYHWGSWKHCLFGAMGTFLGIDWGGFNRYHETSLANFKTVAKYFGFDAEVFADNMFDSNDIWAKHDLDRFEKADALKLLDILIAERKSSKVDPNVLTVKVIQADADKAGSYTDSRNCLLATALKRQYPNEAVSVNPFGFRIGDQWYNFSDWYQNDKVHDAYHKDLQNVNFTITAVKGEE